MSLFPWVIFRKRYCSLTWSFFLHYHQDVEHLFSLMFCMSTYKTKMTFTYNLPDRTYVIAIKLIEDLLHLTIFGLKKNWKNWFLRSQNFFKLQTSISKAAQVQILSILIIDYFQRFLNNLSKLLNRSHSFLFSLLRYIYSKIDLHCGPPSRLRDPKGLISKTDQ